MSKFLFLLLLISGWSFGEEWDQYDDEDLALSIPKDAVGIPAEFRNRVLKEMKSRSQLRDVPENRCFCNYGVGICDQNSTCIKHDGAACYHSIEERYNKKEKRVETWHKFGCATLERGSGASHLTCNTWRAAHKTPKSIACCYRGNYCNKELQPKTYVKIFEHEKPENVTSSYHFDDLEPGMPIGILIFAIVAIIMIILGTCIFILSYFYHLKTKTKQRTESLNKNSMTTGSTYLEKQSMLEDSGSGSGQATLLERTVRQDLTIVGRVGQGRYGEVRKATYRGSYVAVKTFYTTDEDSWKNERDVYQTQMLNHENILQFVAADIWSEEDSMTKMLLVTDYHELGSLSDYLRREETLTTDEALKLIYSCVCGIEHLHAAVQGTGNYKKPEIAHRDIKSKNIIVKRAGVCCIADLGLALRNIDGEIVPTQYNIQVGTKRYMAPELLSMTLNPRDFSQFKMTDIYSMALVMWEVARRVEDNSTIDVSSIDETHNDRSESSGIGSNSSEGRAIRVHRQKTSDDMSLKAKPYMPPFDTMVDSDPSMEQMRELVCVKEARPPIESAWVKGNNIALCELSNLMKESWHRNPQHRHTALKLKKEIYKLIDIEKMNRSHKNSGSMTKTSSQDADSGIANPPAV